MTDKNSSSYKSRILRLTFGLLLYSVGPYLNIQSDIGLAPWEAFSIGISNITSLTYGAVHQITGLIILLFNNSLKEKIGLGTLLNIFLIGFFVNLFLSLGIIPKATSFSTGLIMLLIGQIFIAFGSYYYIGSGLGSGPRDSLMIALGKALPKVPIGVVRGIVEGSALLIGWLLKAKIGIGTVIAAFGVSFIIQLTFDFLHFDVKKIEHESFFYTINQFIKFIKNKKVSK